MSFRVLIIPAESIISEGGVSFINLQMSQPLPFSNAETLAKTLRAQNKAIGNQVTVRLIQTTMIELSAD